MTRGKTIGIAFGIAMGIIAAIGLALNTASVPTTSTATGTTDFISPASNTFTTTSNNIEESNSQAVQDTQPVMTNVNSLNDIQLSPSEIGFGWEEFDAPNYRSYPPQSSTFSDSATPDYTETLEYDFVKREGETTTYVEVYLIHAVSEEKADYLHNSYVINTMQPTPESSYPINGVDAECAAVAGKDHDSNQIYIRCFKKDILIVVNAESTPYLPSSVEPDIVKFAMMVAEKI